MAKTKKNRTPFVPRHLTRLATLAKLYGKVAAAFERDEKKELQKSAETLVSSINTLAQQMAELPPDYKPSKKPVTQTRMLLSVGMQVAFKEEWAAGYDVKKNSTFKVAKISEVGEARGKKYFVKLETKDGFIQCPASHVEQVEAK